MFYRRLKQCIKILLEVEQLQANVFNENKIRSPIILNLRCIFGVICIQFELVGHRSIQH